MMITLQAWAYEYILVTHPFGLPILRFASHAKYLASIMRWREDIHIHPTKGICKDVRFYKDMISKLVPNYIRFRPYCMYHIWDELIGIYHARILSGR